MEAAWDFLEKNDVIILQETWLEQGNELIALRKLNKEFKWWAKAAIRSKQKGRASGGHLIGIKKSISANWEVDEWEYGMILKRKEKEEKKEFWIISVYNNVGFGKIVKQLSECVEEGMTKGAGLMILGDLNARIGEEQGRVEWEEAATRWGTRKSTDKTVNREGRKLLKFCETMGLIVLNGRIKGDDEGNMTYVGGGGNSVLDLVIEMEDEEEDRVKEIRVVPRIESDHLPVVVKLRGMNETENTERNTRRKRKGEKIEKLIWEKREKEKFEQELQKVWTQDNEGDEMETKWLRMKQAIWEAARKAGMIKISKRGKGTKVWFNGECKEQRRKVWQSLKRYTSTGSAIEKENLKAERKILKAICERNRKEWFEKKWQKITGSRTMEEWWAAVGFFRARKGKTVGNISNIQWVEHFSKLLGSEERRAGEELMAITTKEVWEDEETESASLDSRLDEEIGAEELIKAVRGIRNKKAPGEDGITAEFIKGLPTGKWAEFRKVLNTIWEKGEMVKGWEISRIFPIFKAGDEDKPGNYRGVSLLDVGYKILTSIMVRRINRWVEEGKILRESQAGFRGKRGTRDHIFVLNSLINNRIKKKGGKLYVAFVDFKAAFDKVNRKLMLRKIWEKGIKGKMHRMIRGIYRETNNEVISEEGISEGFKTENGVR